jgi:hypothetical protein
MDYVKVIYPSKQAQLINSLTFGVLRTNNIDPNQFVYHNTINGVDHYIRKGT